MGFFDFFRQPDIGRGIEEYRSTPDALLLDVRTPEEYRQGHIPGSSNVPLQQIDKITAMTDNRDIPLFVYCHSGSRSRRAVAMLQRMGYTKAKNIGGIAAYAGRMER